ncbi:MAG TPA: hypothetical protein ENK04_13120 [Gammaproteobacteria bacterium]|nr:hypothetical protein [Gammaproteobacteria bacterium]
MEYYVLVNDDDDEGLAWIRTRPDEIIEHAYLIEEEKSLVNWWPDEVVYDISPDRGIRVADYIPNLLGQHIVSEKLKQLLEAEAGASFDFYPVKLRNQKGRIVKNHYYLAHLRLIVSVMDRDKSDFDIDHICPSEVATIRRLVLKEDDIPDDCRVFVLKEKPSIWLMRDDFAKEIFIDQDCVGLQFVSLENYGAMWR